MDASKEIKSMKLYDHIDRVYKELKELGYKDGDPLKVEDVCKFDQMHYYGTQAIDEAVQALGINSNHHVLDVGSGLGGPARYLAHKTGCLVTAIELQDDLHKEAENLTQRCNLQQKLKHVTGDFLQMDLELGSASDKMKQFFNQSEALPRSEQRHIISIEFLRSFLRCHFGEKPVVASQGDGKFDFLVSWLVFLHIEDKNTLLERCFNSLNPGGKIFIEDFFQLKGVTLSEEDKRTYNHDLYMNNLPEKDVYINLLKAAGFSDIQFKDKTPMFLSFVSKRPVDFSEKKDRHVRVIGQDAFDGLQYFYTAVKSVFEKGLTGGCCIIATKPALN